MSDATVRIRLLFSDGGAFHHEELTLPESSFQGYDRLIDALREDPELLKRIYLDVGRLCAAWEVGEGS
ncbi:hypothetical protein ACFL5A_04475 [Gemmatimonadota bacterium]